MTAPWFGVPAISREHGEPDTPETSPPTIASSIVPLESELWRFTAPTDARSVAVSGTFRINNGIVLTRARSRSRHPHDASFTSRPLSRESWQISRASSGATRHHAVYPQRSHVPRGARVRGLPRGALRQEPEGSASEPGRNTRGIALVLACECMGDFLFARREARCTRRPGAMCFASIRPSPIFRVSLCPSQGSRVPGPSQPAMRASSSSSGELPRAHGYVRLHQHPVAWAS